MSTYTTLPTPNRAGASVRVRGMIQKIRVMSGFAFVLITVGRQTLQCVWSPETGFPLESLSEQMAVEVEGIVVVDARSRAGIELHLRRIRILSVPVGSPPVVGLKFTPAKVSI